MSAKKRSAAAPAETAAAAVEAPPAPAPAAKAEPAKQQPSAAAKSRIAALTGPQKAAAVVVSLGADKASQLYKYMDPEDVETLTLEVARLGYLDSEMTEGVLTDFYEMCMTNKAIT